MHPRTHFASSASPLVLAVLSLFAASYPASAYADAELEQIRTMSTRLASINVKLVSLRDNLSRLSDCKCSALSADATQGSSQAKPPVPAPERNPGAEKTPATAAAKPEAGKPAPAQTTDKAAPGTPPQTPKPDASKPAPPSPPTNAPPPTQGGAAPEANKPSPAPNPAQAGGPAAEAKPGETKPPQTTTEQAPPKPQPPTTPPPQPKPAAHPPADEGLPLLPIGGGILAVIILFVALIALKKRFVPSSGKKDKDRMRAEDMLAEAIADAKAQPGDEEANPENLPPADDDTHVHLAASPATPGPRPTTVAKVARPGIKPPAAPSGEQALKPVDLPALEIDLPLPEAADTGRPPVIPEKDQALELAEVMISMGLAKGAAETLVEHIRANPKKALFHWLKLLDIYKKTGNKEEFVNSANDLRRYFNIQADESQAGDGVLQSLEEYPHLMKKIQSLWQQPDECTDFLARLLEDNRGGTRQGFPKAIAEEILLMIQVLRDPGA